MADNERIISREIPAVSVPYGEPVTLPKGANVSITHRMGGNFTVVWDKGMALIGGEHAEALGEPPPEKKTAPAKSAEGPPDTEQIWEALKTVYDPEIPVNIVDLGLVYAVDVKETAEKKHEVNIKMTLTAPGCAMGPVIAAEARRRCENVPGVSAAAAEIVWDPPWEPSMISEEGKMRLGLL